MSQSTVSLVLNHMTGAKVSPATRERVFAVAEELGYQLPRRKTTAPAAPPAASGVRRNLIVYLADELSTTSHPAVTIDGARAAAWEHNCLLSVHVTGADRELEDATLETVLANPAVLGVVYATIFTREVELPVRLARRRDPLPCVLLNCLHRERMLSSVIPGEVGGGYAATEHLIEHGHRRIGFINGEPWMDAARDRLKGYRQALATADLPFDPRLVRDGDWMSGSGFEQAMSLLQLERRPTALFCANDLMALGALEAARQLGLSMPDQLSIVGYDDLEIARHAHPALTTVLLPNFGMGQWAVERLIEEAAAQEPLAPRQIKMDCPLVPRDSVAEIVGARQS
ncbi:transcriptional regulator, LacI family-like protein [Ramlibacter tataouinensis TTB310]|uniref:Transcriptional regulator, LacI family-like protein n=1 Tax=Ramlibacter tataouinensis (strain ATCC BAA-407 / DSM 14655 / LMG 21543 / TTB310) TaxID=365046 RepID=F5XVU7_RAMTT|nr:transcriptional regulator, LacI family-like protein [Ramlibacter tataouinensis TTB310]